MLWRELGRRELSLNDLALANVEGKPMNPSVVRRNFGKIAGRAGP